MEEKQVPLLSHSPEYPQRLLPGGVLDSRMQARISIYTNDLRSALEWLRLELEAIVSESLRREELNYFIWMIDQHLKAKPTNYAQELVDAYVTAIDKSCRNSYCNGYRTRFGKIVDQDIVATIEFAYMAGDCRGKLMSLYYSGEYITDEAIAEIIRALPVWES